MRFEETGNYELAVITSRSYQAVTKELVIREMIVITSVLILNVSHRQSC